MSFSIGVDIVDVKDFSKRIARTPSLTKRLFTPNEIKSCEKRPVEHLASRLAAKEAFKKASGIDEVPWHSLEINSLASGKPIMKLDKNLRARAGVKSIDVSLRESLCLVEAEVGEALDHMQIPALQLHLFREERAEVQVERVRKAV